MGTRINFRAHANSRKTRLQKFNFPCSIAGTGGSPLIPTSVRKESNGRKDVLLFLSNLFFRPIRFDRTRDRGFFEIPLVEIKISTRRCISGRERGGEEWENWAILRGSIGHGWWQFPQASAELSPPLHPSAYARNYEFIRWNDFTRCSTNDRREKRRSRIARLPTSPRVFDDRWYMRV